MRATPSTSPFFRRAGRDQREGRGLHADAAGGARQPGGLDLGADIDHVRLAGGVEVGERLVVL